MSKKIYWKDLRLSFTQTKGRFFSIFCLMMIGSTALIGLKVTSPNMTRTAQHYINQYQMVDLAVMSDYGLSEQDVTELQGIPNTKIELGYFTDVTISDNQKAIRLYSQTNQISQFKVVEGKLPQKSEEIALSKGLASRYNIGDTFTVDQEKTNPLKNLTFTVTGFVQSSEIWDENLIGQTNKGHGELTGYAVVDPTIFDSDVYTIARLVYKDVNKIEYNTQNYIKGIANHQRDLEKRLEDNGNIRLDAIRFSTQKEIDKGFTEIRQKEQELANTEQLLAQRQDLLTGSDLENTKQLQTNINEARKALRQKKHELEQAQKDLNHLTEPVYTVYNRSTLPGSSGYVTYSNSTTSIAAVGNIFPIVLYSVAALVTFTTMTRFVDEERHKAGIFKALGFSNQDIIAKFVIYGLVSSFLGTLAGLLLGNFVLSPMIDDIISKTSIVGSANQYFYLSWTLLAFGLALVSAVLPAYLVARRDLLEEATHLLQAKPPVSGATILLEKCHFIWKRLSFTHKVTARNIFRYKQRMLMTIFGVAGSVSLIFAGLGIQSSISGVARTQFNDILRYDMMALQNNQATESEKEAMRQLITSDTIDKTLPVQYVLAEQSPKAGEDPQQISLIITDSEQLTSFVKLRERHSQKRLLLTHNGVIISEKLATLFNVGVGDDLSLTLNNKQITVKISGITELYAGHFIYLTKDYYEKATNQSYQENAHLIALKNNTVSMIEETATKLLHSPAISAISQNTTLIKQVETISTSLNSVMILLVILAVLLAMVILYNLTTINVAERVRELSTIKVLGFHNKEVTLYIYRETIILSILGMGAGLLAGKGIHALILDLIGGDAIMFNPSVSLGVYLIPLLAISGILILLGLLVNHQLRQIDMLEALKSVE